MPQVLQVVEGIEVDFNKLSMDQKKLIGISKCVECTGECEGCVVAKIAKSGNTNALEVLEAIRQQPDYKEFDAMAGELVFGGEVNNGPETESKQAQGQEEAIKDAETIRKKNESFLELESDSLDLQTIESHMCVNCTGDCPDCIISKIANSPDIDLNKIIAAVRQQPDYRAFDPMGGELTFGPAPQITAIAPQAVTAAAPEQRFQPELTRESVFSKRDNNGVQQIAKEPSFIIQPQKERPPESRREMSQSSDRRQALEKAKELENLNQHTNPSTFRSLNGERARPIQSTSREMTPRSVQNPKEPRANTIFVKPQEINRSVNQSFNRFYPPTSTPQLQANRQAETTVNLFNRQSVLYRAEDRQSRNIPEQRQKLEASSKITHAAQRAAPNERQQTINSKKADLTNKQGKLEDKKELGSAKSLFHDRPTSDLRDKSYPKSSKQEEDITEIASKTLRSKADIAQNQNQELGIDHEIVIDMDMILEQELSPDRDQEEETEEAMTVALGLKNPEVDANQTGNTELKVAYDLEAGLEEELTAELTTESEVLIDPNDPKIEITLSEDTELDLESDEIFNGIEHIDESDVEMALNLDVVASLYEEEVVRSPNYRVELQTEPVEGQMLDLLHQKEFDLHILEENLIDIATSQDVSLKQLISLIHLNEQTMSSEADPLVTTNLNEFLEEIIEELEISALDELVNEQRDKIKINERQSDGITTGEDINQALLLFMFLLSVKKFRGRLIDLSDEELYLLRIMMQKLGKSDFEQLTDQEIELLLDSVKAKLLRIDTRPVLVQLNEGYSLHQ